jgi:hypothetical protein
MRFRLPMERRSIPLGLILNGEMSDQHSQTSDEQDGAGDQRGRPQGRLPAAPQEVDGPKVRLDSAS